MHTSAGLLDLHARTHRCLKGFLDHCAGFSNEELAQELEGFGYPSIRVQLHHVIGAEQYWFGVLRGEILTDEREADYASIEALRAFRDRVAAATRAYLEAKSDADLNASCTVTNFLKQQTEVVPANVVLRTQTHIFQHLGQVSAMSRLLGRPIPSGLDFPLA